MSDFTQLEQLEGHIYGCPSNKLTDYKAALLLYPAYKIMALNMLYDIAFDYEGEIHDVPMWNSKLLDLICG